jgi:hypothetical protein
MRQSSQRRYPQHKQQGNCRPAFGRNHQMCPTKAATRKPKKTKTALSYQIIRKNERPNNFNAYSKAKVLCNLNRLVPHKGRKKY